MTLIYVLLAVAAGWLIPVQAGLNASLRHALGHPLLAGVTNFLVGGTLLLVFALLGRVTPPSVQQIGAAPWWLWIGGAMGACLVTAGILFSHRLGAATFMACIIFGQLTASVLLDHFGWAGYQQHSISGFRVLGLALLGLGVYLIRTH